MIHLIYIYFVVNAFIAGTIYNEGNDWRGAIVCFLIGIPTYIYLFFLMFCKWLEKIILIKAWYRLYFTDHFSKMEEWTIKIRSAQYHGQAKLTRNANWYERIFLRQIDKKYNYGITKSIEK